MFEFGWTNLQKEPENQSADSHYLQASGFINQLSCGCRLCIYNPSHYLILNGLLANMSQKENIRQPFNKRFHIYFNAKQMSSDQPGALIQTVLDWAGQSLMPQAD